MKILDYYYMVLLRGYENIFNNYRLYYRVPSIMSMTLAMNVFSIFILFNRHTFFQYGIWMFIILSAVIVLIMVILDAIYNKKRRKKLIEQYEDESLESRRQGMAWVWCYEIFSILFLIWALSRLELPHTSYV